MSRLHRFIDRWLECALAVVMGSLVLCVLWQVASRYLLTQPSPWTEELARFLLIWISLLGAAYLTGHRGHIAIDMLSSRLDPVRARRLEMLVQVVILFFATSVLLIGGLNLIHITLTLGQVSPSLGIPVGYVYVAIPASGVLIIMYSLLHLARLVLGHEPSA